MTNQLYSKLHMGLEWGGRAKGREKEREGGRNEEGRRRWEGHCDRMHLKEHSCVEEHLES